MFAKISAPLHKLAANRLHYVWNPEANRALPFERSVWQCCPLWHFQTPKSLLMCFLMPAWWCWGVSDANDAQWKATSGAVCELNIE